MYVYKFERKPDGLAMTNASSAFPKSRTLNAGDRKRNEYENVIEKLAFNDTLTETAGTTRESNFINFFF